VDKARFAAEWGSIEEVRVDPVRDYEWGPSDHCRVVIDVDV
jgi:hypothetical protein